MRPARAVPRFGMVASLCALLAVLAMQCGSRRAGESSVAFTVRDDLDRAVSFPAPVRRCVSLAPSITESIFFLDADSLLVGVTRFCDFPAAARRKASVGDMWAPDIEKIIALKPDVVFVSREGNTRQTWTKLEQSGLRTFVTDPRDVAGVIRSIERIAAVLSRPRSGRRLDSLRAVLAGGAPHLGRAGSVLFLLSTDPLMTAGRETLLDELIVRAGAVNAAHDVAARYPVVNREAILSMNPSVLLVSDDLGLDPASLLTCYPEWRSVEAFRRGAVHTVDADLFLRPGPRIGEGMRMLSALIRAD